jgi:hypothetical protein
VLKVTLDGQDVDTEPLRGQTLAELIRAIENRLMPERVIISMVLDGRPLDSRAEKAEARMTIDQLHSLEIQSQRVDELTRNTVLNLIEFIPSLAVSLAACVESLQGGDEESGQAFLRRTVDGLQIVTSAWPVIAKSLAAEGYPPERLIPRTEGINEVLRRVSLAQESGDQVQLCDLLEFELAQYLEDWHEHAQKLEQLLETKD